MNCKKFNLIRKLNTKQIVIHNNKIPNKINKTEIHITHVMCKCYVSAEQGYYQFDSSALGHKDITSY